MPQEGLDLLEYVWSQQSGDFVCVSTKDEDGKFQDHIFDNITEAQEFIKEVRDGVNIYWAPMTFTEARRKKEAVAPVRCLWQDLDTADPKEFPDELKPTIAWESSPGRYQALWMLDKDHDPGEIADLNKALAYHFSPQGADKGGWDLTQVLRIPGTRNYKRLKTGHLTYPSTPLVKLLWNEPRTVSPDSIRPHIKAQRTTEPRALKIPSRVRELLRAKEAPEGKRSSVLWYIEHELAKAGFTPQQILGLIKKSVWNKFKGRRDEDERLTHEISRAVEDEVIPVIGRTEKATPILKIESDLQFMANASGTASWLVKDFWTRRSHGIVGGEPKTMKSTLTTDFMISIASGLPFLGQFEVLDTGPVIMIQNENDPWILRDRVEKIRYSKGMTGSVDIEGQVIRVQFPRALPLYYMNQQGFSFEIGEHRDCVEQLVASTKPALVIFDPLYLMFDGDINSAKDLSPILTWLLELKKLYQTGIVLVHHWGKNNNRTRGGQKLLGSISLYGWLESAWYLEAVPSKDKEGKEDEINTPIQETRIIMEREFRGVGHYPKLDLSVRMGAVGEPRYDVEVLKHGAEEVPENQLNKDVLAVLSTSVGPMSLRKLTSETGASRRAVTSAVESLAERSLVVITEEGVLLAGRL